MNVTSADGPFHNNQIKISYNWPNADKKFHLAHHKCIVIMIKTAIKYNYGHGSGLSRDYLIIIYLQQQKSHRKKRKKHMFHMFKWKQINEKRKEQLVSRPIHTATIGTATATPLTHSVHAHKRPRNDPIQPAQKGLQNKNRFYCWCNPDGCV